MISLKELQAFIAQDIEQHLQRLPQKTQYLPLMHTINQVTAVDIFAPSNLPAYNLSAMDGYALAKNSDLRKDSTYVVIGESVAGSPFNGDLMPGEAVRIMTGAIIPTSCDTVIMQENVQVINESDNHASNKSVMTKHSKPLNLSKTTIRLTQDTNIGKHIRKCGEEVLQGEMTASKGTIITPQHVPLFASMGLDHIEVIAPVVIGLIASGDELVALGSGNDIVNGNADTTAHPNLNQADGQLKKQAIVDANTPTLTALFQRLPVKVIDYGILPDDFDMTKQTLMQAANECDVVISSAGVSVGDYDYLIDAIQTVGKIEHYKLAMKPGKPLVYGKLYKSNMVNNESTNKNNQDSPAPAIYFGLPGNPLSTFVGAMLIVLPALWQLAGAKHPPKLARIKACLTTEISKKSGRRDFQRGWLKQNETGQWQVAAVGKQESHRVKQLSQCNCLLDLDAEQGNLQAGDWVWVRPLSWQI